MTKLAILTSKERLKFDMAPHLTAEERNVYFSLAPAEHKVIQSLRSPTHKVGFLEQLGYFKANGKFFSPKQFRQPDINHVANMLGIASDQIDMSDYHKQTLSDHRQRILTICRWQPFDNKQHEKLSEQAVWLAQRQLSAKNIFSSMQRPDITRIKQISQLLRSSDIQQNVEKFSVFKKFFLEFKPIIDLPELSDQATEYFAIWVQKSTAFQLSQFSKKTSYICICCAILNINSTTDRMYWSIFS